MKFNDSALILNIHPYGEDSAIIKVFSHYNGLRSGFVKNINSKTQKNIYQIGNLITTDFYYKQPEKNLAKLLYSELVKSYCLNFLLDRLKFNLMQSLLHLLHHSLTENIIFHQLFEEVIFFANELGILFSNFSNNVSILSIVLFLFKLIIHKYNIFLKKTDF